MKLIELSRNDIKKINNMLVDEIIKMKHQLENMDDNFHRSLLEQEIENNKRIIKRIRGKK